MRLGISMFAGDAGKSGISEYMRQISSEMVRQSDDHQFTLFMANSDRVHFGIEDERVELVTYPDLCGHPIINIFWHLFWLPIALRLHRCEAVFLPAANRRLGWFYTMPSVGTVHDFSQLHVPAKYDRFRMFYVMKVLPKLMRRLNRVISISRATERDLISFARVSADNIEVVYNGARLLAHTESDEEELDVLQRLLPASDAPFLLYVSRLEVPGKNHINLLRAFAALKRDQTFSHKLVLVGSRWSGAELIDKEIIELGLEKEVIITGFVSTEELSVLYRRAELFVFPSLFEGFGIPLLEAMAAGTPVCSSDRASMPEVVGEAGLLFDPSSVDLIAESISEILANSALSEQLVAAGLERVRGFNWGHSAQSVLSIIEETLHTQREGMHRKDAERGIE